VREIDSSSVLRRFYVYSLTGLQARSVLGAPSERSILMLRPKKDSFEQVLIKGK